MLYQSTPGSTLRPAPPPYHACAQAGGRRGGRHGTKKVLLLSHIAPTVTQAIPSAACRWRGRRVQGTGRPAGAGTPQHSRPLQRRAEAATPSRTPAGVLSSSTRTPEPVAHPRQKGVEHEIRPRPTRGRRRNHSAHLRVLHRHRHRTSDIGTTPPGSSPTARGSSTRTPPSAASATSRRPSTGA